MNEEFFIKEGKYKKFTDKICGLYVKSIDDYKHILKIWDMLEFNSKLNKMLIKYPEFKQYFLDSIKQNNNDIQTQNNILSLFRAHKYSVFNV